MRRPHQRIPKRRLTSHDRVSGHHGVNTNGDKFGIVPILRVPANPSLFDPGFGIRHEDAVPSFSLVLVRRNKLTLTNKLNTYTQLLDHKLHDRFSPLLDRGATDQELDQLEHNWQRTLTPDLREFYKWARGTKQPATQVFPAGWFVPVFSVRPRPDVADVLASGTGQRTGQPVPQKPWRLLDFTERDVLVELEGPDEESVWYLEPESRYGCFRVFDDLERFVQRMTDIADTATLRMIADDDTQEWAVDGVLFSYRGLRIDQPPGQPDSLWD